MSDCSRCLWRCWRSCSVCYRVSGLFACLHAGALFCERVAALAYMHEGPFDEPHTKSSRGFVLLSVWVLEFVSFRHTGVMAAGDRDAEKEKTEAEKKRLNWTTAGRKNKITASVHVWEKETELIWINVLSYCFSSWRLSVVGSSGRCVSLITLRFRKWIFVRLLGFAECPPSSVCTGSF